MNAKAILTEPIFIWVIVLVSFSAMSNISQSVENNPLQATQANYDLATKWQNLRFGLEEETTNWIIGHITTDNSCDYNGTFPDFSGAKNGFENATNILCTVSSTQQTKNGQDYTFTFNLDCSKFPPNGTGGASFSQQITYNKRIVSSCAGTGCSSCTMTITDLQSGLEDYSVGSTTEPWCNAIPSSQNIAVGQNAPFQVEYHNFTGPPANQNVTCGASGATGSVTLSSCTDSSDGTCTTAVCGSYNMAGTYTITPTLYNQANAVACNGSTVNVTNTPSCTMSINPNSISQGGSTTVTINYSQFTGTPGTGQLSVSCGSAGAGFTNAVCTGSGNGSCSGTCGAYSTAGGYTVSATMSDGSTQANCGTAPLTVNALPGKTPIRQYLFDSQSGGKYLNTQGTLYDLAINNTFETRLQSGKSVNFRGYTNDSYLKSIATNTLSLANSSFSISFWMNPRHISSSDQRLFTLCPSESTNQCIQLNYAPSGTNSEINAGFYDNDLVTSGANIQPGKWSFVVFTYDRSASTGTVYVNGISKGQRIGMNPYTGSASQFCLGAWCHPGGYTDAYYGGKMEDFRVYDSALTQPDITGLYTSTAIPAPGGSPVAEWLFESPNPEHDSSANQLDLAFINNPTFGAGRRGNAITFDTSTASYAEGDFIPLDNRSYTIAFWMRSTDNADQELVSECETGKPYPKCFNLKYYPYNGSLMVGYGGVPATSLYTSSDDYLVPSNTWAHVAVTFNNANQKRTLFVNGVPVKQDDDIGVQYPFGGQSGTFCLGRACVDNSYNYKGQLDEVHVWNNAAKSESEIRTLIASEGGLTCQELDPSQWLSYMYADPSLVLYHRANNNANDSTGNASYNGTMIGADFAAGCVNQAYRFDADNEYVRIPSTISEIAPWNSFAIRAWVKTSQATKGTILEQFGGTSSSDISRVSLYVNEVPGKVSLVIGTGSQTCTVSSTTSVNDGQWHRIIARNIPNDKIAIFVDGQKENEISSSACDQYYSLPANASIGGGKTAFNAGNPNGYWFKGLIDELAVFYSDGITPGAFTDNEARVLT